MTEATAVVLVLIVVLFQEESKDSLICFQTIIETMPIKASSKFEQSRRKLSTRHRIQETLLIEMIFDTAIGIRLNSSPCPLAFDNSYSGNFAAMASAAFFFVSLLALTITNLPSTD